VIEGTGAFNIAYGRWLLLHLGECQHLGLVKMLQYFAVIFFSGNNYFRTAADSSCFQMSVTQHCIWHFEMWQGKKFNLIGIIWAAAHVSNAIWSHKNWAFPRPQISKLLFRGIGIFYPLKFSRREASLYFELWVQ
jgi:hypothetical protein